MGQGRKGTELPSGTVTFLFTDVERSTQTVAAMGAEAYAHALDTHRQLLRDAFTTHHGVEVGTEGDAFFVAFATAHDAVQAAVGGQTALGEHPLRVRMGLHTGEALVRESDYVGHDVHKAKRVSDAGNGGQILLSQATAELVRDRFELVDLGPHRLKDLGEPQRLFQVGRGEFPPVRSLESFRHNLPTQRTAFIGRDNEIAEITKLLENNRLVTLTGVGGCGKTRLAQQVGAEAVDRYPDGVFFVDLAQLADPDAVAATIASAVGVPMGAEIGSGLRATTDELLFNFLSQRACLVILDNCEHLLDACAEMSDRVLADCPDVTLLATSREALDVDGEQPWRVPSLSLPTEGNVDASEAVSLFKTRARTARPDFELHTAQHRRRCGSLSAARWHPPSDRVRCRARLSPVTEGDLVAAERHVQAPRRRPAAAHATPTNPAGCVGLELRAPFADRASAPPKTVGISR